MNKNISLCLLVASVFILDTKCAVASSIDTTFSASPISINIGEEITLSLTAILNPTHTGEAFVWQDLTFNSGAGQTLKQDFELPDGTTRIDNTVTFSYDLPGVYFATLIGTLYGQYTVAEDIYGWVAKGKTSIWSKLYTQYSYPEQVYNIDEKIQISVNSPILNLPVENIPIITNLPVISANLPAVNTTLITNQPIISGNVPEPESIWLLLAGILSMALGGRRKVGVLNL